MKNLLSLFILVTVSLAGRAQALQLNDREYFERQGVNVLVYSNNFNGGFNDEKNSGIEIIHHGVRTVQGGAVRLNNTPEQWDLVPKTASLMRILADGTAEEAFVGAVKNWGPYYKYNYVKFDFTSSSGDRTKVPSLATPSTSSLVLPLRI